MTTLAELRQDHRVIRSLAEAIPAAASPACTVRALADLSRDLGAHLAREWPALEALCGLPRGQPARLAGETRQREATALAESFAGFGAHWMHPGAIERAPAAFATAWGVLHAALLRLIAREESEIYPLVATTAFTPKPLSAPPATGLAELDEDHAAVFGLIGGLRAALGGGRISADAVALNALAAYAERHFAREETLMAASDYPGLEDHRREHARARDILLRFRNDHADGRQVEAQAVLSFLEGWLVSHITEVDLRMAAHLATRLA